MGRFSRWKPLLWLLAILIVLVYTYTFFNGGNTEGNLITFLKTDGLKAVIVVVIVSILVLVFQKVFKVKIKH